MSLSVACPRHIHSRYQIDAETQISQVELINKSVQQQVEKEVEGQYRTSADWNAYHGFVAHDIPQNPDGVLLALNDTKDKISGYVTFSSLNAREHNVYVNLIAVDPADQRKGVGRALMNRLFEKAIKKGYTHLVLDFRSKARLTAFYTRFPYPYELKLDCGQYDRNDRRSRIIYDLTSGQQSKPVV